MAWPNIFQRRTLLSRFSHHHEVVKTFSKVKVSISKQWAPSAFHKSVELPVEIWSSNR
ncbi:hypothetical protein FD754_018631 [Muntiacus muntjak]|uniref:Uncharacterized protein n=1 Tax=Muntiacus muntjak TaxID=9888 RepID=A0A5N3UY25_MUNMU|nr:hypothetical protein FD754_018631 [Muntiacus muntjak]